MQGDAPRQNPGPTEQVEANGTATSRGANLSRGGGRRPVIQVVPRVQSEDNSTAATVVPQGAVPISPGTKGGANTSRFRRNLLRAGSPPNRAEPTRVTFLPDVQLQAGAVASSPTPAEPAGVAPLTVANPTGHGLPSVAPTGRTSHGVVTFDAGPSPAERVTRQSMVETYSTPVVLGSASLACFCSIVKTSVLVAVLPLVGHACIPIVGAHLAKEAWRKLRRTGMDQPIVQPVVDPTPTEEVVAGDTVEVPSQPCGPAAVTTSLLPEYVPQPRPPGETLVMFDTDVNMKHVAFYSLVGLGSLCCIVKVSVLTAAVPIVGSMLAPVVGMYCLTTLYESMKPHRVVLPDVRADLLTMAAKFGVDPEALAIGVRSLDGGNRTPAAIAQCKRTITAWLAQHRKDYDEVTMTAVIERVLGVAVAYTAPEAARGQFWSTPQVNRGIHAGSSLSEGHLGRGWSLPRG